MHGLRSHWLLRLTRSRAASSKRRQNLKCAASESKDSGAAIFSSQVLD